MSDDLTARLDRWRRTAGLDARHGAPVGAALHEAADEVERLHKERDALNAAMRHLAAEAHRRKWVWEGTSPGAFEELHRLGNELLAALDTHPTPAPPKGDTR